MKIQIKSLENVPVWSRCNWLQRLMLGIFLLD